MTNNHDVSCKSKVTPTLSIDEQLTILSKEILTWTGSYNGVLPADRIKKSLHTLTKADAVLINLADSTASGEEVDQQTIFRQIDRQENGFFFFDNQDQSHNCFDQVIRRLADAAAGGYLLKELQNPGSTDRQAYELYADPKELFRKLTLLQAKTVNLNTVLAVKKHNDSLDTSSDQASENCLLVLNLYSDIRLIGQIWLLLSQKPPQNQLNLLSLYSGLISAYFAGNLKMRQMHLDYIHELEAERVQLKSAMKSIEHLNRFDQLTGLYNRRYFEDMIRKYDCPQYLPLSIAMADANGFKQINDAFGHAFGDDLLCRAAEAIKSQCRRHDVAARLGGDEFVILMPNTSHDEAEQRIKAIRQVCSTIELKSVGLSISFGWETKTSQDVDFNQIYTQAEDRMYRRKLFESPSVRGKRIHTIIQTLNETHPREERHSRRVGWLSEKLGQSIGCDEGRLKELKTIGIMHDIGKIAISDSVLDKCGPLNILESKEIKRHPEIGFRILSTVNDLADLAESVLSHHEKWDGSGYPRQLKGTQIPLGARIVAIADCYDAITSDRPYRQASSSLVACREIMKNAGSQFDPALARIFVNQVDSWS